MDTVKKFEIIILHCTICYHFLGHPVYAIGLPPLRPPRSGKHYYQSQKFLPMKLRRSHCLFALPQCCHFNLYKRSFVLRSLSDDEY